PRGPDRCASRLDAAPRGGRRPAVARAAPRPSALPRGLRDPGSGANARDQRERDARPQVPRPGEAARRARRRADARESVVRSGCGRARRFPHRNRTPQEPMTRRPDREDAELRDALRAVWSARAGARRADARESLAREAHPEDGAFAAYLAG